MDLIPIAGSSLIVAYGWELDEGPFVSRVDRLGLLQLGFATGARWYYFGVPERVFEDFLFADSKGSYFHRFIRGQYEEKVAEEVELKPSKRLSGATLR